MANILHKEYTIEKDDYANAGSVSSDIKSTLQAAGVNPGVLRNIAVASYEAEINMIIHAYGGKVYLDFDDQNFIELKFHDLGPGIEDIEKSMTPGYSTASEKARTMGFGAGMGLPNIKRVSDEFNITSSPEGTHLDLRFNNVI